VRKSSKVERLRRKFRPRRITTLFVGESAPKSGAFFYDGNTNFYRYMKKALNGGNNFLMEFKAKGFFLDDLVLRPVNGFKQRHRKRLHYNSLPSLARRIARYNPRIVISVMVSIHDVVAEAIRQSGSKRIRHYRVPFPGNGHQKKFVRAIQRIRSNLSVVR
jgi:hypothetical protein